MLFDIFKKIWTKPKRPPIDDEEEFIIWILKYYDAPDLELLRKAFRFKLDYFIKMLAEDILKNINEHQNGFALMDFLAEVHEQYVTFVSLIDARGGFYQAPTEIQSAYLQLTAKMVTLPYFLKYKYNLDIPLAEFKLKDLNEI